MIDLQPFSIHIKLSLFYSIWSSKIIERNENSFSFQNHTNPFTPFLFTSLTFHLFAVKWYSGCKNDETYMKMNTNWNVIFFWSYITFPHFHRKLAVSAFGWQRFTSDSERSSETAASASTSGFAFQQHQCDSWGCFCGLWWFYHFHQLAEEWVSFILISVSGIPVNYFLRLCSIKMLPAMAFENLNSLETLSIQNNKLIRIPEEVMEPIMDTLRVVDIMGENRSVNQRL